MKKFLRINLLIMLVMVSLLGLYACNETEIISINAEGYKTEFLLEENFSINQDKIRVYVTRKDGVQGNISVDNLVIDDNLTIMKNDYISIDFSKYDKTKLGEYEIKINYLGTKLEYTYKVKVITKEFDKDSYKVNGYTGEYDGKAHKIEVIQDIGATVLYGEKEGEYNLEESPEYINAGLYKVYYKISKEGYEPDIEGSETIEITKAKLIVKTKNQTISYGEEVRNTGCDYVGFVEGDSEDSLSGELKILSDYNVGDNVGKYEIIASGYEEKNYIITYEKGILEVKKSANGLKAEIMNVTYGEKLTLIIENKSGGEVRYKYQKKGTASWPNGLPENAGEYTIEIYSSETLNYLPKTLQIENVIIYPKELTITPNIVNIEYNEEYIENGVNIEGFVNNETESVLSGELRYVTTYKKGDDAGEYKVLIDGLESENYNIIFNQGILMVEKAENPIKITLSDRIYGEDITYSVDNDLLQNDIVVLYKSTQSNVYGIDKPVRAGTYNVKFTQEGTKNYKDYEKVFDLTIKQKEVQLKWSNTEFIYDGEEHIPQAEVENLEQGDECQVIVSGGKIQSNEIGYIATAINLTNTNYCLPIEEDKKTVTFIINKIIVDVPVSGGGKTKYTGLLQKSTIEATDDYIVYENKGGIEAGQYPVILKLADSINHKWSSTANNLVEINFEILPVNDNEILKCSIKSFIYGTNEEPEYEARYGNIIVEYKEKSQGDIYYTETKPTDVGNYIMRVRVIATESFNFCSDSCEFSILKAIPNYALLDTITVEINTSKKDIELPEDDLGKWYWSDSNYVFEELGTKIDYLNFIPTDTKNYERVERVVVTINVIDSSLKNFNPEDIIVTAYKGNYGYIYEGATATIELKENISDATITYSSSLTGEFVEENIRFTEIGEYDVYFKISKQGYNDYIVKSTVTILDYIQEVVCYDNLGVLKGSQPRLDQITLTATYVSGKEVNVNGSEFETYNFSSSVIGEQQLSLQKDGIIYENVLKICVYDTTITTLKINTYNEQENNFVLYATKESEKQYSVDFNNKNNFAFTSIEPQLNGDDNIRIEEILGQYILDERSASLLLNIKIRIMKSNYSFMYYDYYTLKINYNITMFSFKLGNSQSIYNDELDEYTINDTIEQSYKSLKVQYGEIVGIYNDDCIDYNEENNLLNIYNLEYFTFDKYQKMIIEVKVNNFVYYAKINVNKISLPVNKVTINNIDYEIFGIEDILTIKTEFNTIYELLIKEYGNYYVNYRATSGENLWLNDISGSITIELIENSNENIGTFYVCKSNNIQECIQTITIKLLKDNYIDKFVLSTNKGNSNLEIENRVEFTFFNSLQFEVRQNYSGEIYLNGELFNFDDITQNILIAGVNTLKVQIRNNSNEVVYEKDIELYVLEEIENEQYLFRVTLKYGTNFENEDAITYNNLVYTLSENYNLIKISCGSEVDKPFDMKLSYNGVILPQNQECSLKKGNNKFEILLIIQNSILYKLNFTIVY